jgi:hypothetical protein
MMNGSHLRRERLTHTHVYMQREEREKKKVKIKKKRKEKEKNKNFNKRSWGLTLFYSKDREREGYTILLVLMCRFHKGPKHVLSHRKSVGSVGII